MSVKKITKKEYIKWARFYRDTLDLYIAPIAAPIVIDGKVLPTDKRGNKKYYKAMPIGYKGNFHGKDDYQCEVSDKEVEEWYDEGFGIAVIPKGKSEMFGKHQLIFDLDDFGELTKEEFWKKYKDDLADNFVSETSKGYHIFVFSDNPLDITNFVLETGKGDTFTGEVRHDLSGYTCESPTIAVDEKEWVIYGNYTVANFCIEPGELPNGWNVTNHSVIKKENKDLKIGGDVDIMRAIIEGKTNKGQGQGVYNMNLRHIGNSISKIKDKGDIAHVKKALDQSIKFNKEHKLGYSDKEVKDTFYSILKKDVVSEKKSKIDRDIEIIKKSGGKIIQDTNDGRVYIQIDGKRNYLLGGKDAQRWITNVIEAKTTTDRNNLTMRLDAGIEDKKSLQYRVARNINNSIVYDIGDSEGTVITVGDKNWTSSKTADIRLFKTSPGGKEQVIPLEGGDIRDIFEFVNIEEGMRDMFICMLVYYFIPDVQYPILSLYGEKGSGKSTTAHFIRSIVDPNHIPFDALDSKKIDDARLSLSSSYMSILDNISNINQEVSDMLCLFSTGGGAKKRALFTDGDIYITKTLKPIIMTGVSQEMTREDLLSRAILMEVEPLESYISHTEMEKKFKEKLPSILGGIFDTLACLDMESVDDSNLVRMSEFHRHLRGIAMVLGIDVKNIDKTLIDNFDNQEEESLANSDIADALIEFMEDKASFSGTATEWLEALSTVSVSMHKKRPVWISRDLNKLKGSLKSEGYIVSREREGRNKRVIKVENTNFKDGF